MVRITSMIARRRIHVERLNVSSGEIEGIQRLTMVINETEEVIRKLVLQIDKQVDVFKTLYYPDEDALRQQQVVYKTGNTIKQLEALVKNQVNVN
jgi:acetolactate synthase I/III small subunit